MPLSVTTGGKDELIPPQRVLRLAGVSAQMKRTVLVIHRPEGGHQTDSADTTVALEFVVRSALGLPVDVAPSPVPATGARS